MKKILMIKLHDGEVLEKDLSGDKRLPIGEPANSEVYATLCASVAKMGYSDVRPGVITDKAYEHIAPSSIKSVRIEFRD